MDHQILDVLLRALNSKIEELEEVDVLTILKSYEHIDRSVSHSNIMFRNLTNTVTSQALLNKDDVSAKFLVQYLSNLYALPNYRSIEKQQEGELVKLLEEKLPVNDEKILFKEQHVSQL